MRNLNQPYDLNNYVLFQRRTRAYVLSSTPIVTSSRQTLNSSPSSPYDLSQRRPLVTKFSRHSHQADLSAQNRGKQKIW